MVQSSFANEAVIQIHGIGKSVAGNVKSGHPSLFTEYDIKTVKKLH